MRSQLARIMPVIPLAKSPRTDDKAGLLWLREGGVLVLFNCVFRRHSVASSQGRHQCCLGDGPENRKTRARFGLHALACEAVVAEEARMAGIQRPNLGDESRLAIPIDIFFMTDQTKNL